jgi:hypothetical protein
VTEKREKFYTVSARLVFSSIMVVLIVGLVLGISVFVNHGPINPLLGVIPIGSTSAATVNGTGSNIGRIPPPTAIVVEATCAPTNTSFNCQYPYYNYTTGIFTVAISQRSGYNWTSVTVLFVPKGAPYSNGVPILSWSPPRAVNVTGGLLSNATKYVNIPIASGPSSVGSNITGTIWAKYQITLGSTAKYANISSAVIVVNK